MQKTRLDSKENVAIGWNGASEATRLPIRPIKTKPTSQRLDAIPDDGEPRGGWGIMALKFAGYAAAGLLLLTAVPLTAIAVYGGRASSGDVNGVSERLTSIERLRTLSAVQDPSITPLQAGISLRTLQTPSQNPDFPTRPVATAPARPWRTNKPGKETFVPRSPEFDGPSPQWVIQNVPYVYSPVEMQYLRAVAEWPLWKDFDAVAAAKSVDIVGGMYVLPFKPNASAVAMPIIRYADTKEIAHAAASRVAYYTAIGDTPRAEAAARSIVSFGFALIDNGMSAIDALVGRTIVETGRSAMEQLSMATSRSENPSTTFESHSGFTRSADAPPADNAVSGRELRARQLVDAADQSLPRSVRLERLSQLSMSSCRNVGEVLFGPGADIKDAFVQARTTLARFPSEQAYIDLLANSINHIPESSVDGSLGKRLVIGAATVAATVTNNPRMASCTRFAMGRP